MGCSSNNNRKTNQQEGKEVSTLLYPLKTE